MDKDLALWALGGVLGLAGALALIILNRIMRQGDDTNQKVTQQSVAIAGLKGSVSGLDARVTDLHAWKNEQMAKESRLAADEVIRLRAQLEREREERGATA